MQIVARVFERLPFAQRAEKTGAREPRDGFGGTLRIAEHGGVEVEGVGARP